jgi:hypothetical protein
LHAAIVSGVEVGKTVAVGSGVNVDVGGGTVSVGAEVGTGVESAPHADTSKEMMKSVLKAVREYLRFIGISYL